MAPEKTNAHCQDASTEFSTSSAKSPGAPPLAVNAPTSQRATVAPQVFTRQAMRSLQRTLGNHRVGQLLTSGQPHQPDSPPTPTSARAVIQRTPVVFIYRNGYVARIETDEVDTPTLQQQLFHPDLAEESKVGIRQALMAREAAGIQVQLPQPEVSQEPGNPGFGSFSWGGLGLLPPPKNDPNLLRQARLHVLAQLDIILKYADPQSFEFQVATPLKEAIAQEALYKIQNITQGNKIAESTGNYIKIYDPFFAEGTSDQKRRENIVHETSHLVLSIPDYAYMYNRIFNYLSTAEHQSNPDSIVRLINNALAIPNHENPPGTGWEAGDTGQPTVEQSKARIAQVLDEAAAIISDVLYHLKNANPQKLGDQYPTQDNFTTHVKLGLNLLDIYRAQLRGKPLLLRYQPNAQYPLEETPDQSAVILNVKTEQHIDKVQTLTQKVRWFVYQLGAQPNLTLAKKISHWLKAAFNTYRNGSEYHAQGKYPKILLDWSQEPD